MIKIITIVLFLSCLSCVGYQTVSEMSFLEPIYKIKKEDIISVDTLRTRYGTLYKVKYRR